VCSSDLKISVAVRHYFGQYEDGEERPIAAREERPEPTAFPVAAESATESEESSMEKTPEAILAEEASIDGASTAKEVNEVSAEDTAASEDGASEIDAFSMPTHAKQKLSL